jgi:magnesium-transporting ATPase (P-type)
VSSNRAVFFIDGFNLYHSIDNKPIFYKYKWLNLVVDLCRQFMQINESVEKIFYFTARPLWNNKNLLGMICILIYASILVVLLFWVIFKKEITFLGFGAENHVNRVCMWI